MVTFYQNSAKEQKVLDGEVENVAAALVALETMTQVAEIPTLALEKKCELYDETYR